MRLSGHIAFGLIFIGTAAHASSQTPDTARTASARARITAELALLRLSGEDAKVPPIDSFTTGNLVIPAGSTMHRSLGVLDGTVDVSGDVDGSVIVLGGDIQIHRGGIVRGDALSAGGRVIVDGGRVDGHMRSISSADRFIAPRFPAAGPPLTTMQAVKLAVGWFAVLVIIGFGVLIFAESNLDGVVGALERGPVKSFWLGVLGQIGILPALLILVVALALTLIGVLLIPFAIVAYVIAVTGVVTLGFLAVARLIGSALVARRAGDPSARGAHLSALFVGLVVYVALWIAAAALTATVTGYAVRVVVLVLTWVGATAGLGAAIASRAGTERGTPKVPRRVASDELSWQTPTPITGVAAARRPPAAPGAGVAP